MSIDVRTLYLLNFVVAFVIAGITYFSWYHHRDTRGLRGLALALSLGALGSFELSLRTANSPALLVIMANTLVMAGFATVWMSVRRFNTSAPGIGHAVIPTALFLVTFSIALLSGVDVNMRVVLCSAAIAILSALAGWEVFRGGLTEPLRSRLPTAAALAILAAAMVVRMVFSWIEDSPQEPDTPFYDPTQGLTLAMNTVCIVAMTLGFLMMANERLRRHYEMLARTDELTGLPNRRFFLEEGEKMSALAGRDGAAACIMMIDLDHFSAVNQAFGHAGGDQALITFAATAQRQMRPEDLIARYGGEEFCALLRGVDEQEGTRIAERLRAAIADLSIDLEGGPLRITASIGLAPLDGDLRAAMHHADAALYRAKAQGRNRVCSTLPEIAAASL